VNRKVAERALHAQTALADRLQVCAARHERDVMTGARELRAVVPTDGA
jgi:hypothetical protein